MTDNNFCAAEAFKLMMQCLSEYKRKFKHIENHKMDAPSVLVVGTKEEDLNLSSKEELTPIETYINGLTDFLDDTDLLDTEDPSIEPFTTYISTTITIGYSEDDLYQGEVTQHILEFEHSLLSAITDISGGCTSIRGTGYWNPDSGPLEALSGVVGTSIISRDSLEYGDCLVITVDVEPELHEQFLVHLQEQVRICKEVYEVDVNDVHVVTSETTKRCFNIYPGHT